MQTITRRRFLTAAGALAAASTAVPQQAHAIEPLKRDAKSAMKLSLAGYSFHRQFRAKEMNLEQFIDYCASLGIPGAEPTSYYFPDPVTSTYLSSLKRRAHLAGLSISGGAIANDFTLPPGPKLDEQMAHVSKWIDHYALLGAPTIRVFSGHVKSGEDKQAVVRRTVENFERACEMAGKRGIFLALENHGGLTATALGMLELIKAVKSPWFGVNWDSGNFHSEDPYAELAMIAPYAVAVQLKVRIGPSKKPQPADLARKIGMLREVNYSGWVALEYEADEDPYTAIPRYIDQLDKLIRG